MNDLLMNLVPDHLGYPETKPLFLSAELYKVSWLCLDIRTLLCVLSYWDSSCDEELMEDHVAMNLLFLQVMYSLPWWLCGLKHSPVHAVHDTGSMGWVQLPVTPEHLLLLMCMLW